MNRGSWILVFLAVFSAVLVVFAPQFAWRLRGLIAPPVADTEDGLALENAALKAELAVLQNIKDQLPEKRQNHIRAVVLSRYPMNFKNEFLVNAGMMQGVEKGMAVVFGTAPPAADGSAGLAPRGVLIGRVEKVFNDTALVKTVFDSGFQEPVRVGPAAADALFKGGLAPKIALIPLGARANEGDIIYSASPEFPYGLAIGEIKEIIVSKDKLFREAAVEFAYDINEIRSVFIAKPD